MATTATPKSDTKPTTSHPGDTTTSPTTSGHKTKTDGDDGQRNDKEINDESSKYTNDKKKHR